MLLVGPQFLPCAARGRVVGAAALLLAADADGLLGSASLAGVGLGPLASHRQVAPMAQAAVRADLDESLDVERDLPAQVAFDLVAAVDQLSQAVDLLLGEVTDAGI